MSKSKYFDPCESEFQFCAEPAQPNDTLCKYCREEKERLLKEEDDQNINFMTISFYEDHDNWLYKE